MKKISFYPEIINTDEARDLLTRIHWHFGPYRDFFDKINITSDLTMANLKSLNAPDYLDEHAGPNRIDKEFWSKIKVLSKDTLGKLKISEIFNGIDIVIIWKFPDGFSSKENKLFLQDFRESLSPGTELIIADRNLHANEASKMLSVGLSLIEGNDEIIQKSHKKFLKVAKVIKQKKCHIFGTGPSLEEAYAYDTSDGDVISCNSIVLNKDLMSLLKPRFICAADPIFHAGPSSYAAAFRVELINCMEEFNFYFIVPWRDYFIYLNYLPKKYHERVIGIPFNMGTINIKLTEEFSVSPYPNVLTLLMMPIGASLYKSMTISGCDGRPLDKDDYFWQHHKSSQFNDKMDDIQSAHPGFFKINYNDYYLKHCEQVEDMCCKYENAGGLIVSLTSSYIPALRARGASEPVTLARHFNQNSPLTVLSLNPDLVDFVGHFWNYDDKLGQSFLQMNLKYRIASHKKFKHQIIEHDNPDGTYTYSNFSIDPCLGINSWTLGNRTGQQKTILTEIQEIVTHEFTNAIDRARNDAEGGVIVYHYTSSLEHLKILYELSLERPDIQIVANLFWLKTEDIWNASFLSRYGTLLKLVKNSKKIDLTTMTHHQSEQLRLRTGLKFKVAKHPSPLIHDKDAKELFGNQKEIKNKKQLHFFFPSSNRLEKGSQILYDIALKISELLVDQPHKISFRNSPYPKKPHKVFKNWNIIEGFIEEKIFIKTIQKSDVVILPYMSPDFSDRTSGLTIDSLYAGVPVVAIAGTWLSETIKKYSFGEVAETIDATNIAEKAIDTARNARLGKYEINKSSKEYFLNHSWSLLSKQILNGIRWKRNEFWNKLEYKQNITLRRKSIPMVGPSKIHDEAHINESILIKEFVDFTDGLLIHQRGLRDLDSKLISKFKKKNTNISRPLDLTESISQISQSKVIIATAFPEICNELLKLKTTQIPKYISLQFFRSKYSKPSQAANILAEYLNKNGYKIVFIEYWNSNKEESIRSAKKATLYPYVPEWATTECKIIAFKTNAKVNKIKTILQDASVNFKFLKPQTFETIASKAWELSEVIKPENILAYAERPDAIICKNSGLELSANKVKKYSILRQTLNKRVHRTYIGPTSISSPYVTFGISVLVKSIRFISLWLTDLDNKVLVEAKFDLFTGKLISKGLESQLITGVSAGIVPIAEKSANSNNTEYRLWISAQKINLKNQILCQVVTLKSLNSSSSFLGDKNNTIGLKNFLLEPGNQPSKIIGQISFKNPPKENFQEKPYINLHNRSLKTDPYKGWAIGENIKATIDKKKIYVNRNNGSYKEQFFTYVRLEENTEYKLSVEFSSVKPRATILMNNRIIIDTKKIGSFNTVFKSKKSTNRIDIKALDSSFAHFKIKRLVLEKIINK
jgi:glycosyltransferase involved in cell wall biosynthesis